MKGGGPFVTPSKELIGLHFLYHLEAACSLYVALSFICPFRFLFLLSQQSLCQYCQKRVFLQKKESFVKNIWILHTLVAGAWTEREKMYHGGSFLKLADDNMDIQNPEAQNRELSGF